MVKFLQLLRRSFLVTLAALCLAGCGGGASVVAPGLLSPGYARVQATRVRALDPVSGLVDHAASFTELGLMAEGTDYAATLISNRIAVAGTDLVFAPVAGGTPGSLAYALYAFDAAGYDRDLNVRLTWATAPTSGSAYLALANFATGKWQWFAIPATNIVPFSNLANYISPGPGNALYAAVLVMNGTATLDRLRLGTQPSTGLPTAAIEANRFTVPPGGIVEFDARGSSANPPAGIVGYEFDADDGNGFQPGAAAQFGFQFDNPGTFSVRLRVTDTFGAIDVASTTVTVAGVAGFDEIEPNDDPLTQAQLIKLPTYAWHGNCGAQQAAEPVYDGSASDAFEFTAAAGDELDARLLLYPDQADLDLLLFDGGGNQLAASTTSTGREQFRYTFAAGDTGPFHLQVLAYSGSSDYWLYAALNAPNVTLTIIPPEGSAPLAVTLDASGSTDPDGTIVSYSFDPEGDGTYLPPSASPTVDYTYPAAQVYYPAVVVVDDDDQISYARRLVYPGNPYDEREDNDTRATAGPLPALPFASFTGNVGYSGVYDGEDIDYFSFMASPGDVVRFTVWNTPGLNFRILGNPSGVLAQSQPIFGNRLEAVYTVQPGDTTPLFLMVHLPEASSLDYTLTGDINPPNAVLELSGPHSGPGPLVTTLDASFSSATPPKTIVGYRFDPEGDGTFLPQQGMATLDYTYTLDGLYHPTVLVVDSQGSIGEDIVPVLVGQTYDEVEHNDSVAEPGVLPGFPFTGFRGSYLSGPGYTGFDGDNADIFAVSAFAPQRVQFMLDYSSATGELTLDLLDQDGATLVTANGSGGLAVMDYVLGSADSATAYRLEILTADSFYGDYTLEGHVYNEIEDNDTAATAQPLPAFDFFGFNGSNSSGGGYPGYDGDVADFFGFNGSAGADITFSLNYDDASGQMSLDLLDSAENVVTFVDGAVGSAQLNYVLGSAGSDVGGPYALRVWDVNGAHFGDYSLAGFSN